MLKRYLGLLMAVLISLSIFGCAPEKSKKITIGTSPYPAWYVWYIAKEEGMFEKYGLDVELVHFPVYSDSLQAFNTGKIDMLNIATCDTIAPFNQGVDFKIVLINDNSNGADGLVAKKKYQTIADLKGQKVVTEFGTIEHFFLLKALEAAGLTQNDIEYTNMTVNDSGMAMIAGTVEAACVWEPSLTLALNKGENNLLFDSSQTSGLIPDLVIASGKLLEAKRDAVVKIVEVWFDALEFYNAYPEKAVEHMAQYAEVSVDEMKQMMAGSKLFSIQDNLTSMLTEQANYTYLPYTIRETAEFLKHVNMVEAVPEHPEELLDVTLLQEISEGRQSFPAPDTRAFAAQ